MNMRAILGRVADGEILDAAQAEEAFGLLLAGEVSAPEIAALLMGLRVRGEAAAEIRGAVAALRRRMVPIEAPPGAIDLCGTGGDGLATLNVSTATAFVVAACGVPVAKHGNRAVSSRSGGADVLAALGIEPDPPLELQARLLGELGLAFLFAPRHHAAMRHAAEVRRLLGIRSILNLAGPLSNPARVRRQVVGVFAPRFLEPMAAALRDGATERAWLVHGGGLDELTLAGETEVAALEPDGTIRRFTVSPEEAGLPRAPHSAIAGGDPEANARALEALLDGRRGAYRDTVVLNAAAALLVAGTAADLRAGAAAAEAALDAGGPAQLLRALRRAAPAMATSVGGAMSGPPVLEVPDKLARICAQTREEVARRRAHLTLGELEARIRARAPGGRGFAASLRRATGERRPGLIAEIKRASPSAGVIRTDFSAVELARAYQAGAATCLSVLTEGPNFGGELPDLEAARGACTLPVLRKDFILDEWQVFESRAIGADCILLIMAALDADAARGFARLARRLDLDVLVEVHDEAELERALGLDTALIGINNRNLRTLETDLGVSHALAPHVPPDRVVVSESGIRTPGDIARLRDAGVGCFLVGESLLRHGDVAAATRRLLGLAA